MFAKECERSGQEQRDIFHDLFDLPADMIVYHGNIPAVPANVRVVFREFGQWGKLCTFQRQNLLKFLKTTLVTKIEPEKS